MKDDTKDEKKRQPYEPPKMVDMNLSWASGLCDNGSGDSGRCAWGNVALGTCGHGLGAKGTECGNGLDPTNECDSGTGAFGCIGGSNP